MNRGITDRLAVVLLVEDDPGDQEITRRALAEDVIRTDLRVVADGEAALDYLTRRGKYQDPGTSPRPDLILLDLNMPRMDGRQALEHIRSEPTIRTIPVVVLTTSDQETDIVRSYEVGCNSYITKPVDLDKFIKMLRELDAYWFGLVTLPPS